MQFNDRLTSLLATTVNAIKSCYSKINDEIVVVFRCIVSLTINKSINRRNGFFSSQALTVVIISTN